MPTRSYDTTKRRAKARQTRRRIIAAARDLFIRQGYGATSIAEIADTAEVSDQTIYKTFDTKRDLLYEVVAATVGGDENPVPLLDRPWVAELRAEPDPHVRLRLMVAASRRIYARTAAIQRVVAEAAAVDADIADLFASNRKTRLEHHRELLKIVTADGALLDATSLDEAAEYLWAVMSPELYELTVEQRNWTPHQWEHWITTTLEHVLLRSDRPQTSTR